MNRRAAVLGALLLSLLAACAGVPSPPVRGTGSSGCGDLCETLPCPQAYRCSVTSRCERRCEPEQVSPNWSGR